jgi:hypothetical protein
MVTLAGHGIRGEENAGWFSLCPGVTSVISVLAVYWPGGITRPHPTSGPGSAFPRYSLGEGELAMLDGHH